MSRRQTSTKKGVGAAAVAPAGGCGGSRHRQSKTSAASRLFAGRVGVQARLGAGESPPAPRAARGMEVPARGRGRGAGARPALLCGAPNAGGGSRAGPPALKPLLSCPAAAAPAPRSDGAGQPLKSHKLETCFLRET